MERYSRLGEQCVSAVFKSNLLLFEGEYCSFIFQLILIYPSSGLVKGVAKAPEIAEDDLNIMFATNVTGLINLTQAILPIFQKRPNGGQGDIINIGSIAGMPLPISSIIECSQFCITC